MELTNHLLLVLRLKKEFKYTSAPPLSLHVFLQGELYIHILPYSYSRRSDAEYQLQDY
jgi:hypothetical protein